ncbi:MAG: hypothetical protein ACM3U2_22350 [Deltaproteobacteria bacterium]
MKRVLVVAFMIFYVGALTYGNICHLVQEGKSSHPLMYFLVWDMFCGWTAFDSRIHIVAEAESGKFYDLTHPPYGELHPYGYIGRENYDQFQNHTPKLGLNVLKHTRHEPMTRLFVIEECWAKKYNMADAVWKARYDDAKDLHRYYRLRVTLLPDGTVVQSYSSWLQYQYAQMMMDNPRLVEQANRSRTLFVLDKAAKPGRDVLENSGTGFGGVSAPFAAPTAPSGN